MCALGALWQGFPQPHFLRSSSRWQIQATDAQCDRLQKSSGSGMRHQKMRLFDARRKPESINRSRKWKDLEDRLQSGVHPVELLQNVEKWRTGEFWDLVVYLDMHQRFDEAIQAFEWWKKQPMYRAREEHFVRFIIMAGKAGKADAAQQIFDEMEAWAVPVTVVGFTALIQSYGDNGNMKQAEAVVKQMLDSGLKPNVVTYANLIRGYGKLGLYDEMAKVFNTMKTVQCPPDFFVYKNLIEAYSRGGLVGRMDKAFRAMLTDGWRADAETLNMVGQGFAAMGMIKEMEQIQAYLNRVEGLPDEATIRAMALAYIRQNQFYQMGEFVQSLGLKTSNAGGNLLWNLLLLSSAANFSMKNLQREALNMAEARREPDLTTFNIRALAFSRMQMFWDLHILVQHLHSMSLLPDLVTCGAVVDAYVVGRLTEKLPEALDELQLLEAVPDVRTEAFVFEAFGKGRFQVFCEDYMRQNSRVTYSTLITCYFETLREKRESKRNRRAKYRQPDPDIWQRDSGF